MSGKRVTVASPVWFSMPEIQSRPCAGACERLELLTPIATSDELSLNSLFELVEPLRGQQVKDCLLRRLLEEMCQCVFTAGQYRKRTILPDFTR